ncbi:MAG: MMPL family transporter [Candidatus Pristimantibacillus lignocellulolyticus]|uniref:MMPL family transporter n=1 Tax=Candidatus Pristimantibacillus lignocellulolyticus TaxID=2994561 RepID=A0A9J6ZBN5_9BACL|nr:MAG: MMPL family transporter [Candidatus Pristimantibacillus lignocellulolyticus]
MIQRIAACFTGKISKWVTLVVWILIALILTLTLPSVGDKEQNNAANLPSDAQSVLADQVIQQYFPNSTGVPALLVWHRDAGLTEEDFSIVRQLSEELTNNPLPSQESIIPLHMGIPIEVLTSEDGSTLILPITFTDETETEVLKENLVQMKEFINEKAGANIFEGELTDGLSARFTGPVGISVDATDLFLDADIVLLIATVLLVLVLLLVIYRSPILAIIPLVGVGFAYLVTSPILGWLAGNGWITVDSQAISIMTVLLFGAGTDYCLFLITRYRDDLRHEKNPRTALIHAFQNASGAIAMSGFTVVMALLVLLFAQYGSSHRFAIPFSLSILIMGIASLTLVPAILAILGRSSFYPFIPRTVEMEEERAIKRNKPVKKQKDQHRLWGKIGSFVTEKPWLVISITMIILIVLASFSTQLKYKYDLLSSFPDDMESREGFTIIGQTYTPGELAPITVIVKDNSDVNALANKVASHELVNNVTEAVVSEVDSSYSSFEVVLDIDPYSNDAMDYIPVLEEQLTAELGNTESFWIAGQTAGQYDTQQINDRDNSVIMPIVILLIVILLLVYLRSIIATIYLVVTVLVSFLAALGLGWIILHYGLGIDAIQAAIPLYAFVFLIALGEDYNIFMISGIWKKAKTMPLKQAVKEGVAETGEVISSAGLILAGTFFVLTQVPITILLQFGVITAIGVLLDTFIVRPFLVPALTVVCGKWAFWPSKHTTKK